MNTHLVLIADANRDSRELYRVVFDIGNYRVAEAASVAEALHAANRLRPDLILMDWRLPDGDGFALCEALRRHGPTRHLPVIATTSVPLRAAELHRARQLRCVPVLTKPVPLDALVRAADEALQIAQSRILRASARRVIRYARNARLGEGLAARLLNAATPRSGFAPVALIVADNDGRYVAVNDTAAELTGYDPRELTAMSVADLTPPARASAGQLLWSEFMDDGAQEGVYLLRHRDGASISFRYVAIANVSPGLHVSALAATSPQVHPLIAYQ